MKSQKKKVFISFNPSMEGSLRAGNVDFIMDSTEEFDYDVINFEYLLEVGDISKVPFSAADLYSNLLFDEVDEYVKNVNDSLAKLRSYDNDSDVQLFVFGNTGNEICNLYCFAEEFKRFANVKLNFCHTVLIKTPSCIEDYTVVDNSIELTNEVLDSFSAKWKYLVSSNSAIRVSRGGEIVEYSFKQAMDMVLSVFSKEYERFPTLYSKFLKSLSEREKWTYISFEYIAYILIKNGILERTADTNTQSGYSDIFFEQKFRII